MRIEDLKIDVSCPECKREFQVNLRQVQDGAQVTCPGCKRPIRLKNVGDDLTKLDKSMKDLERSLKDLNIDIDFKL